MSEPSSNYEKTLSNMMFQEQVEKSFTDKVLNRDDNKRLQQLMKQKTLSEDDIHEILHLISTVGNKLVNFNDWDRYLLGKAFAWIREFGTHCINVMNWEKETTIKIKTADKLLEIAQSDEMKKKVIHDEISEYIDKDRYNLKKNISVNEALTHKQQVLNETLEIIQQIKQDVTHNFKFIVDVFNYLSSSTLSLSAAAFDKLTSARFEYHYPDVERYNESMQPKSRFNFNLRGR